MRPLVTVLTLIASLAGAAETPSFTIAHITDEHLRSEFNAPTRFKSEIKHIRQNYPEICMVMNTGDAVDGIKNHNDAVAKWGYWTNGISAELKGIPVYSILGNHDIEGPGNDPLCGSSNVCHTLGMPSQYYSFDTNGWHFIMLDGNGFGKDTNQWNWLVKDLSNVSSNKPVVVLSHQPIFSMGAMIHSPGDIIGKWKDLVALFVKYPNVKLCMSGHTHLYDQAHYNGVTYVCGGALSGYWWELEKSHDGKGAYHETKPGYGIIQLFSDGKVSCKYVNF